MDALPLLLLPDKCKLPTPPKATGLPPACCLSPIPPPLLPPLLLPGAGEPLLLFALRRPLDMLLLLLLDKGDGVCTGGSCREGDTAGLLLLLPGGVPRDPPPPR